MNTPDTMYLVQVVLQWSDFKAEALDGSWSRPIQMGLREGNRFMPVFDDKDVAAAMWPGYEILEIGKASMPVERT